MNKMIVRQVALVAFFLSLVPVSGCVRRTMIVTTAPTKARIFLNDQEIGRSEVSTDFIWYGDYDVTIRAEGFKTLNTGWLVKAPWYQRWPIDFLAEVLWPVRVHDVHRRHFELEPFEAPSSAELIERATDLRERALRGQS